MDRPGGRGDSRLGLGAEGDELGLTWSTHKLDGCGENGFVMVGLKQLSGTPKLRNDGKTRPV